MDTAANQNTTAETTTDGNIVPIQNAFYQELTTQAQKEIAANLNLPNLISVDESSLGDFPWFWQMTGNFTEGTYTWLNNIFSYNAGNPGGAASPSGYAQVTGDDLTTAYYDTVSLINYTLSDASQAALNNANTANAVILNTVYNDWISAFGPMPSTVGTSQTAKMSYIITQVLGWGATGTTLTLDELRNSLNAISLLPNMPLGSETVVNDLMTYLAATSAVGTIQSAVVSFNKQLAAILKNVQDAPAAVGPGWMQVGASIEPEITIDEDPSIIKNALYPSDGTGNSFSVTMTATTQDSNTVSVSTESGYGGIGAIDWLVVEGSDQTQYSMSSFAQQNQDCKVTITFNGVTTVTPHLTKYDISSNAGWWAPTSRWSTCRARLSRACSGATPTGAAPSGFPSTT